MIISFGDAFEQHKHQWNLWWLVFLKRKINWLSTVEVDRTLPASTKKTDKIKLPSFGGQFGRISEFSQKIWWKKFVFYGGRFYTPVFRLRLRIFDQNPRRKWWFLPSSFSNWTIRSSSLTLRFSRTLRPVAQLREAVEGSRYKCLKKFSPENNIKIVTSNSRIYFLLSFINVSFVDFCCWS